MTSSRLVLFDTFDIVRQCRVRGLTTASIECKDMYSYRIVLL